ncbi:MAG: ribosome-associated translation inhibitor RaiA [Candidatus Sumerlaeota bacterium]|nr:ribosome-associated translation inhibitor RaiA [Candidatus Sumerlaeota bacterium]
MPLNLTGRHLEITDEIRDRVEQKTTRYQKFFPRISLIEVELTREKNRYAADILVKANKAEFRSSFTHEDLGTAFEEANEKIIKQMEKKKSRYIDRKKSSISKEARVVDLEEAASFVKPSGLPTWIHPELIEISVCTVEEAVEKLKEEEQREFFIFKHAHTGAINVIYLRKDGEYGLIES